LDYIKSIFLKENINYFKVARKTLALWLLFFLHLFFLVKISGWNRGWNRGYVPKMAEDHNVGCCQKHWLYHLMLREGCFKGNFVFFGWILRQKKSLTQETKFNEMLLSTFYVKSTKFCDLHIVVFYLYILTKKGN